MPGNLNVLIRVRKPETNNFETQFQLCNDDTILSIVNPHAESGFSSMREFLFDRVYLHHSQEEFCSHVHDDLLMKNILQGVNVCFITYGAQSSGKTYSLFGTQEEVAKSVNGGGSGVFQRALDFVYFHSSHRSLFSNVKVLITVAELYADGTIHNMIPEYFAELKRSIADIVIVDADLNLVWVPLETVNMRAFLQSCSTNRNKRNPKIPSHLLFMIRITQQKKVLFTAPPEGSPQETHPVEDTETISATLSFLDLGSSDKLSPESPRLQYNDYQDTFLLIRELCYSLHKGVITSDHHQQSNTLLHNPKLVRLYRVLQACIQPHCHIQFLIHLTDDPTRYEVNLNSLIYGYQLKHQNRSGTNREEVTILQKDQIIRDLELKVKNLRSEVMELKLRHETEINQMKQKAEKTNRKMMELTSGAAEKHKMDRQLTSAMYVDKDRLAAEQKIQDYQKEIHSLNEKLKKKNSQLDKLQKGVIEEEKLHKKQIQYYRQQVSTITTEFTNFKRNAEHFWTVQEKKYQLDVKSLKKSFEEQVHQLEDLLTAVPDTLKSVRSTADVVLDPHRRLSEAQQLKEYQKQLTNLERTKDEAIQQQKSMYEDVIKNKTRLADQLVNQYETYKKEKEEQIQTFQKELMYLFDYATKLSKILYKLEKGVYPIQQRFNLSRIVIFDDDKPDPLRSELLPHLKDKLKLVNEYMGKCEQKSQALENMLINSAASPSTTTAEPRPKSAGSVHKFRSQVKSFGTYTMAATTTTTSASTTPMTPSPSRLPPQHSLSRSSLITTGGNIGGGGGGGGDLSQQQTSRSSINNNTNSINPLLSSSMDEAEKWKKLYTQECKKHLETKVALELLKQKERPPSASATPGKTSSATSTNKSKTLRPYSAR